MRRVLLIVTFALFIVSVWIGLIKGQVDPIVRNIIYFHVPNSICALLCFCVVLVGSIGFLVRKTQAWDLWAAAAAEVGLVFATVLNLTGMVFSRAEWDTWWTPSPRLITSAILWFLYVGYLILRSSINSQRRRGRICAVFGIIAFLDVPLVYISARFTPDIHRATFSFDTAWQNAAMGLGILATLLLGALLIWLRFDLLKSQVALEELARP